MSVRLRVLCVLAWLVACGVSTPGHAGGLDLDLLGPRGVGRAGATAVSEDGAIALLSNPAGIVRRTQRRVQLGVAVHDNDARFVDDDAASQGNPTIIDRAPTAAAPLAGIILSIGRVVVGAVYVQTGDLQHSLPLARANDCFTQECLDDLDRLFPHRHGGSAFAYRRHTLAVGASIRVNDWLGLGAAVNASSVELDEARTIWAGFSGRDMPLGTPLRDMTLSMSAADRFVPGATVGALVAPYVVPMELAASISVRKGSSLRGDANLDRANNLPFPQPLLGAASSELLLESPVTFRAGIRYVGDKLLAEVDGELVVYLGGDDDAHWDLGGVQVVDNTALMADLVSVPALASQRSHAAVRAAADIEVVPGFLWLTVGYALRTAAQARDRYSPAYADIGGHTLAIGAEGQWADMTFTIGYAKTLTAAVRVEHSSVMMVNPFDAGTRVVGAGTYDAGHDAFGASLEVSWQ